MEVVGSNQLGAIFDVIYLLCQIICWLNIGLSDRLTNP